MKVTLELDLNQIQTILNGLGELPAKNTIELILIIKSEAEKQIKETEEKAKKNEDVKK
jgi:hypothetical protein